VNKTEEKHNLQTAFDNIGNTWDIYASGYKKSADILADEIIKSEGNRNDLVYPMILLYRQYFKIEILDILKHFIHEDKKLEGRLKLISMDDIEQLWSVFNDWWLFKYDTYADNDDLKYVHEFITKYANNNPALFESRYPDKNIKDKIISLNHVNVIEYKEMVSKFSERLDSLCKYMCLIDRLSEKRFEEEEIGDQE
jgi:hypothetical protein